MYKLLIIFCSLLVFLGCKSQQKKLEVNSNQSHGKCKLALVTKPEIIAHYDSSGAQFKWIKVKTKINTTVDNKNISFTAALRIKKDSLIYASITKSGIPFAKLLIKEDSIKFVDLFNNKYKKVSFNSLNELIGFKLPFIVLQKFLFGVPTFLYSDSGQVKQDSLVTLFNNSGDFNNFQQSVVFTCDTLNLQSTMIDYGEQKITISYSNPNDINGFVLNKNITILVNDTEKVIILADIEIQRIKKFDKLTIPFSIPIDYEKMD